MILIFKIITFSNLSAYENFYLFITDTTISLFAQVGINTITLMHQQIDIVSTDKCVLLPIA
ncbi:MAG: hypothetical protein IPO21_14645 [Bacteroidales bacterium]|nr:hypothetical protein [Bacteroidales bacterium]